MGKYVIIYGEEIPVKSVAMSEDDGEYSTAKDEIHLKDGLSAKKKHQTLIHEMVHAVLTKSGIAYALEDKMEEAICSAMDTGLKKAVRAILRDDGEGD